MRRPDPRIVETSGGRSISCGQLWLYSRYAPKRTAERAALAVELTEDTLYVLESPCFMYGVDRILERLPPGSAVIGVELVPELLGLALESASEFAGDPRYALASSGDPSTVAAQARALGAFRRVAAINLNQGNALAQEGYARILAALNEDISIFWRNRVSLMRMGRLWTRNLFSNLGALDWSRASAPARRSGPVVVCGAGPSLDLALPFLRSLDAGVHVMACDTASGALARAGVRVDSVVCLEAQIYNVADFLPLGDRRVDAYVDLSTHPSSFRALGGPLTVLSSRWADCALLDRLSAAGLPLTTVPPLGSVGVLALHLAASWFGGPLFIAGLDFAFPQGRTHCAGSPTDLAEYRSDTRTYRRDGRWAVSFRDGSFSPAPGLRSDPALAMYARLAARELAEFGAPGGLAYDLRQGLGLPLPARPTGFDEALTILKIAARSGPVAQRGSAEAGHGSSRARAFLENELDLAMRLRDALRSGSTDTRALIDACDYMFLHFPDPERVRNLEQDALNRLAAETLYWQGRLEGALS